MCSRPVLRSLELVGRLAVLKLEDAEVARIVVRLLKEPVSCKEYRWDAFEGSFENGLIPI